MESIKVVSYVGGHDVVVYKDAVYDPSIRKYRGGTPVAVIPYAGRTIGCAWLNRVG